MTEALTPQRRKYIYGILIAALPLLVTFGLLDDGTAGQVALIAAAVLGVGESALALANTPSEPKPITSERDL